jgi:hypothetical protein
MGGGDRAVADPDAGQRRRVAQGGQVQAQVVLRAQARQIGVDVAGADIERRPAHDLELLLDPLQERPKGRALGLEVQAGDALVIAEPPVDLRRARIADEALAAIMVQQIVHGRPGRGQAGLDQRPVAGHAAEDRRPLPAQDVVERDLAGRQAFDHRGRASDVDHRMFAPSTWRRL